MMHTMYGSGAASGFFLLGAIHVLACLAFLAGIIFLFIWAIRTLSTTELKKWGIILLVAGFVLCALTFPWGIAGMHRDGRMMKYEMGDDRMSMSMDDMAAILEGKTGDDFDAAFIAGMIPHHQGAIDMANAALKDAKHEEIKRMAKAIVTAQQKEIDQMKQWRSTWGYEQ